MPTFDAIVLGVGGVGSAALYELARRGARVLGIDRFAPPHEFGSSHGQSRVIRQSYFEHPDYVPLLVEAYRMWRELEQTTRASLLDEIGLIQVGPSAGIVVPGVLKSARLHHLPVESLPGAEVERRWPGLRAGDEVGYEMAAVYEPRGGLLFVEACVRAHLDAAQAAGAVLRTNVEAQGWSANEREVQVVTSAGTYSAATLIVTAGAWASRLLVDLNLPVTVRRKSLFWFEAAAGQYDRSGGMPIYLFETPAGVFYGFPKLDARGIKVAEHTGGIDVADPLTVDRSELPSERQKLVRFLGDHLPAVSHHVTDHTVCLYTMSPDEHFIVDRHPLYANVAFAAGLSGHGFKFAPVLGRVLSDMALEGTTPLPVGFLSLARLKTL